MEAKPKTPCTDLPLLAAYLRSAGIQCGRLDNLELVELHAELIVLRDAVLAERKALGTSPMRRHRLLAARGYVGCHIAATEGAMRIQAQGGAPDLFRQAAHATMSQAVFQRTVRVEGERA